LIDPHLTYLQGKQTLEYIIWNISETADVILRKKKNIAWTNGYSRNGINKVHTMAGSSGRLDEISSTPDNI
jgi:hypothetical protein